MLNKIVKFSALTMKIFNHLTHNTMKKPENRFKNNVFCCSVENSEGEIIKFYQTAKTRFEAYEEICKLYPFKAGYSRRIVGEQI